MTTFHLTVVTPDGCAFDGQAERIVCRAIDGDLAILANHGDYCTALGMGEILCRQPLGIIRVQIIQIFPADFLRAVGIRIVIHNRHTRLCQNTDTRRNHLIFIRITFHRSNCLIFPRDQYIPFLVFHKRGC